MLRPLLLFLASSVVICSVALAQTKRRIAVLDFDFSNVSNPSILGSVPGVSKGVSEILVNRLVKDGTYSLIERSRIEAVLAEQNLGQSGRLDPATVARVGKILGVDAVIIGSVTRMDIQERRSGFGGAILPFGLGVATTDVDAYVQLNIRMVSTSTGEILAVAEGQGNVSQSDSQVAGFGSGFGGAGGASTSNAEKLLFLSTAQAIDQVSTEIVKSAPKLAALPVSAPDLTAIVADISGNTVTINRGSNDGFQVGMRMSIERLGKEVKDPATGEVLRRITQPIGQIQITEVNPKFSLGRVISGTKFNVGDVAKPLP